MLIHLHTAHYYSCAYLTTLTLVLIRTYFLLILDLLLLEDTKPLIRKMCFTTER